jgi:hypothetical protein
MKCSFVIINHSHGSNDLLVNNTSIYPILLVNNTCCLAKTFPKEKPGCINALAESVQQQTEPSLPELFLIS